MALVMAVVVGGGDTLEQRRLWVGPWGPLNLATTAIIIAIIIITITFIAATTFTSPSDCAAASSGNTFIQSRKSVYSLKIRNLNFHVKLLYSSLCYHQALPYMWLPFL